MLRIKDPNVSLPFYRDARLVHVSLASVILPSFYYQIIGMDLIESEQIVLSRLIYFRLT